MEQQKGVKSNQEKCKKGYLYNYEDGLIGMSDVAVFLFEFFDKIFENMALENDAEKKIFPTLLPVEDYQKTGYLKLSPQYAMFCSDIKQDVKSLEKLDEKIINEEINELLCASKYALSPAACLHVYIQHKNTVFLNPKIFTFCQNVFRNEGEEQYSQIGRLRDYHVREIVFIGSHEFVLNKRKVFLEKTEGILKEIGLSYVSKIANDPFILPQLEKYKKIQIIEKSKIEIQLNIDSQNRISGSSYNLHGTAFSYPFDISVRGVAVTETGCVGFGIERWVIAFLKQFGDCPNNWPSYVYDKWKKVRCRKEWS